jgi:hypothetical protein
MAEDILLGTVSELEMSGVDGGIDIHLIEDEFIKCHAKSRVITLKKKGISIKFTQYSSE